MSSGVKVVAELTGLYEPVESYNDPRIFTVESAIGLVASVFCSYVFTYEVSAMPPSLK